MKPTNSQNRFLVLGILMIPLILAFIFNLLKILSPSIIRFPSVFEIYQDFIYALINPSVLNAIKSTAKLVIISAFFSMICGVFFSFLLNINKKIWTVFEPTIDFLRSIPVTFFIPAFAVILGFSSPNIVWLLAVIPSTLIIVVNISHGIKQQNLIRLHQYYLISNNKNKFTAFRKVTFHEVLPYFISGFKIALSYAIVIVTVMEYMQMGNETGLGTLVYNEMEQLNYKRVYSIIMIVGLIGYLFNKAIDKLYGGNVN